MLIDNDIKMDFVMHAATAGAKSFQSCLTLCDPRDGSPSGSPIPGILQARTLEWVAISFSNAWKWKVKVKSLSHIRLLATPWTAAYQAPPSVGFSRQEYLSGLPLPSLSMVLSRILTGYPKRNSISGTQSLGTRLILNVLFRQHREYLKFLLLLRKQTQFMLEKCHQRQE